MIVPLTSVSDEEQYNHIFNVYIRWGAVSLTSASGEEQYDSIFNINLRWGAVCLYDHIFNTNVWRGAVWLHLYHQYQLRNSMGSITWISLVVMWDPETCGLWYVNMLRTEHVWLMVENVCICKPVTVTSVISGTDEAWEYSCLSFL